jgi:hypothetical protein
VDGLHLIDCEYAFNKGGDTEAIDRIVVKNVTGTQTDLTIPAINILDGDITEWTFESIHTSGGRLINIGNSVSNVPAVLEVNGFTCKGDATTAHTDIQGVAVGTGGDVTRVKLSNGKIDGMYYGIKPAKNMTAIDLHNVELLNNLQDIVLDSVTVGYVKQTGGAARGARHADSQQGIVCIGGSGAATVTHVDGIELDTVNYYVGGAAACSTFVLGAIKTHSGFLGYTRSPAAGYIEVLSGSLAQPRMVRCTGTPEGAVTASIGCLALRTDGSTSTTLYVKTSGANTNTGWTAK